MATRSDKIFHDGVDLTAQGMVQMAATSGIMDAAEELVVEGAASLANAAEKLGKAEVFSNAADAIVDKEAGSRCCWCKRYECQSHFLHFRRRVRVTLG